MKRSAVIATVALALGLLVPTISQAAPKAGAKCTKKGKIQVHKSYEFTCIKKNGKLVWSKGQFKPFGAGFEVSVPKEPWPTISPTLSSTPSPLPSPTPTPTATATPSPEPTPEIVKPTEKPKSETDVQNLKILENSWSQINTLKSVDNSKRFTYLIDPKFPKESLEAIKQGMELMLAKFDNLLIDKRPMYVIFSTSLEFELEQYKNNEDMQLSYLAEGKDSSRYKWRIEHYDYIKSGLKNFVSGGSFPMNSNKINHPGFVTYYRMHPEYQDPKAILLGAHETFHLIQWYMNSNFPEVVPAWWIEGQTQMAAESVSANAETFEDFDKYLKGQTSPGYGGGFFSGTVNLREIEGDPITRTQFSCKLCTTRLPYSRGKIAIHYLTGKFSHEKVVKFMGSLNTKNLWWQQFEKSFGISVEQFYSETEKYMEWYGDYFSPGWRNSQF